MSFPPFLLIFIFAWSGQVEPIFDVLVFVMSFFVNSTIYPLFQNIMIHTSDMEFRSGKMCVVFIHLILHEY